MSLVQFTQGNLIGGVSQQPPALRSAGECTEMLNCLPSPVEGLMKRLPAKHVAALGATPAVEKYHTIYRDGVEQYLLRVNPSGVSATNLITGAAASISDPNSATYGYLASVTAADQLEIVTVGDTSFILNKNEVTAMDGVTASPVLDNTAILFLRQGDYSASYRVALKLNGVVYAVAETTTWKGNGTAGVGEVASVKTEDIMEDLTTKLDALGIPSLITVTQTGSLIEIVFSGSVTSVDYVHTEDSIGDSVLSVIHESVPRVEGWLPEVCRDGYKVQVVGDGEIDADDYFVEFRTDGAETGNIAKGKWQETVGPGVDTTLDPDTLPHILVSTAADTFEWLQPEWGTRVTGDADTNKDPSFVGLALNNLFFYKDRLGFLTGQQVIMSETGNYYNFFRSTLLTLRDSARIDVATNHTKVTVFENAVAFNENMLLFSRRGQFVLRGSDILSPRTVQILPVAEYESSIFASPEPTAKSVYFPYARGQQSGLRELFQTGDILTFDASDVTASVPNYIQGSIKQLAGSTLENVVLAVTEEADGFLYLHNYLWSGDQKAQNAWGKWSFPGPNVTVKHAAFVENTAFLVIDRDGVLSLESVDVASGLVDTGLEFVVHLDRRVTETDLGIVYDSGSLTSTITLPYALDDATERVAFVERDTGLEIPVTSQSSTTAVVQGDFTSVNLFAGVRYEMEYTFTVPLVKMTREGAVLGQHHIPQTVRFLDLQYSDARTMQVEVTLGRRATRSYELSGVLADTSATALDGVALHDGSIKIPVPGPAATSVVVVRNDTPYPSNIVSASWEINYRERARRV